nr:GAP family protein [Mycobacterium tuberculosis]
MAGLGILATGGPRVGTDRVRRASVADPASPHRNAGLDARIRQLHPGTRRLVGAVLVVVRPEVLIICAAAGLAIGSGGHGAAGSWIYTAFFAMLAASTVAIPILAYVAAGDRLDDSLERLKDWMEKNHAGMVAAILVVIGLLLLYNGVHAM